MFAKAERKHLVDESEKQDDRLVDVCVVFDVTVTPITPTERAPHVGRSNMCRSQEPFEKLNSGCFPLGWGEDNHRHHRLKVGTISCVRVVDPLVWRLFQESSDVLHFPGDAPGCVEDVEGPM